MYPLSNLLNLEVNENSVETKEEISQVKKCMYSIQKGHVELKNSMNSLYEKMKDINIPQPVQAYNPMTPREMMMQQMAHSANIEDSHDDGFYSDDEFRSNAMSQLDRKPSTAREKEKVEQKLEEMYPENEVEDQQQQELSYNDLSEIIKEYLDEEVKVDKDFSLIIDCSKEQDKTLIEVLSSKTLPHLSMISLQNMESEQEIVARFMHRSLQKGVDTLVLNEYCTNKIVLDYYIIILQYLIYNRQILNTLVIRDAKISSEIFQVLINVVAASPISLEIGWGQISNFESLKIEVAEEDQHLLGLEVSYCELGDKGKVISIIS